ncbi:MAG: arylesterase [Proteobacteria bacterium]|nr:arylesterase [Pseudomonadota bacterium]
MDGAEIPRAAGRFSLTLWRIFVALALIVTPLHAAKADQIRLLVFGDSLSAGYGLAMGEGFTAQLGTALREDGMDVKVLNGGVSGDTTAGGLARLDWMLSDEPDAVIVELGANDGLRGLDPNQTQANLDAILNKLKQHDIPALLTGMLAPPNMGGEYGEDFNGLYPMLATRHDVVFYPFFLEGVAGNLELNQGDAVHPNAEGVAEIIRRILPSVKELLARLDS